MFHRDSSKWHSSRIYLIAGLSLTALVNSGRAYTQSGTKAGAKPAKSDVTQVVKPTKAEPAKLEYHFKTGQMVVYLVTIRLEGAKSIETLSGPVAYQVTSIEDGNTLRFRSALETKVRVKEDGDEKAPADPPSVISGVRKLGMLRTVAADSDNSLKVDNTGALLRQGLEGSFPAYLGSLSRLMLETLPDPGVTNWNSTTEGNISVDTGSDKVLLAAREKAAYTLETDESSAAKPQGVPKLALTKRYDLATRETVGGEARIKVTGEGKTLFDPKAGIPSATNFEGVIAEASKNNTTKTQIKITGKLLEGEDREQALQLLRSGQNVGDDIEQPVRDPDLLSLISLLKSGNKSQRKQAADKLASWPPNENRPQVARALAIALTDGDLFARWSSVTALGVWYTKETIPDLIKRLDDPEHAVRWETEKVLGQIKDPRACMPLALMVDNGTDRDFAANALEAMGPIAEEVAIKLLGSDAWEARNRAAKMLAKWGSKEAVPTLRLHLRDTNGIVAMASQDALKNIATRGR